MTLLHEINITGMGPSLRFVCQSVFDRVEMNVIQMSVYVFMISDHMVVETMLGESHGSPDLMMTLEIACKISAKRLNDNGECGLFRFQKKVKMIRQNDIGI